MKTIKIEQNEWTAGIEALKKSFRLIGPAKEDAFYDFKELGEGEQPDFDFLNTRLSAKSLVHPQSQIMFKYSMDENDEEHNILKPVAVDDRPQVVVGIRPCDADAFLLVKRNFDTPDVKDPYWLEAYERTTFVGLACHNPCSTCFCTSAGSGPFNEAGLDVLLVERGDHFLASPVTDKGKSLLESAGWKTEIDSDETVDELKQEAESKIESRVPTDRLSSKATTELYEAPFWEEAAFACINCGTCTYLCPTCWCFDIQDEVAGNAGIRMRNWDSCMYPLFTLHGSGHNPRGTKTHRVRQRFMHKLKYYIDKYGDGIQCVGCGRCIQYCPVNIDIRNVCTLMNSFGENGVTCEVT